VPRCNPIASGVEKTFGKIREKSTSKPLTRLEAKQLLETLKTINFATFVLSFLCLNSGRRVSEVLALTWKDVDFEKKQVSFLIKKLAYEKRVSINYSDGIFDDLALIKRTNLVSQQTSHVFLRNNGQPLSYQAVWQRFRKASRLLNRTYTPHNLRATFISIAAEDGKSHTEIQSCSGHSSLAMVAYYDHGTEEGNLSKNFSIV
jgi:integrase